MRSLFVTLLMLLASTAGAADYALPAGAENAAERINRSALEGPIRFLASDLLEGRGPASTGDRLTQLYLATEMQSIGLEPGGPGGSWYQPFDIVGINAKVPDDWTFRTRGGQTVTLDRWDEFIAASGVQNEQAAINDAEVVFVGYGIQAPEYRWDDFKNVNLKGKVLLMLNNDPDWDPKLFEGNRRLYYGRWTYKYESAAAQGAAGAIIIHTVPSAGYPWQVVQTSWTGEQFQLPAEGEPRIDVAAWVTEDAAKELLSAAGHDLTKLAAAAKSRNFKPVPLGITTSLTLQNTISRKETANVLGLLRGSERPDEVVVYTAHHDHLGLSQDTEGDRIYNGALDNASGTSQLLAIARAFAALPQRPSRSILFNFVGAEEQGLLGSEFYAAHPTFPPGKMAANLNFDGANIWGRTRDIVQVGFGKSAIDDVVRHFATKQDRVIKPEQFPDRGFYYRSDQFNFAKIGVPAIYLDTGVEFRDRPEGWGKQQIEAWEAKQYHQPSDEIDDSWNFEGMIEDARLGFYAGLAIAEMETMPAWNPGDEFEAARKKALAEASR